jgi:hypothetical protein
VKFSELVRLLEHNGFTLIKEKGSIRYYGKSGIEHLVRIDYHVSWFKGSADRNLSRYPKSGWDQAAGGVT